MSCDKQEIMQNVQKQAANLASRYIDNSQQVKQYYRVRQAQNDLMEAWIELALEIEEKKKAEKKASLEKNKKCDENV